MIGPRLFTQKAGSGGWGIRWRRYLKPRRSLPFRLPFGTKGGIRSVGGIHSIAPSGGDLELDAVGLDRQNRKRPFTQRLTDEGESSFTQ